MAYNKDTTKDNRRKPSTRMAELKRAVRDAERENNTRNREIQDSFKLNSTLAGFDCAEKMTAPKELDSILLQDYSRAETLLTMDQWQEQKSRERIARREATEQRTESAVRARTIGAACDRLTVSVVETLSTLSPAERGAYYANINAKLAYSGITDAGRDAMRIALEARRLAQAKARREIKDYENNQRA